MRGFGENAVGVKLGGDTYSVRDVFSDAVQAVMLQKGTVSVFIVNFEWQGERAQMEQGHTELPYQTFFRFSPCCEHLGWCIVKSFFVLNYRRLVSCKNIYVGDFEFFIFGLENILR